MGQWEQAHLTWRRFSTGIKEGSYHWFDSRYRTAWALIQLDKPGEACDVLTMTLVLHPDFGDDELKNKFVDLRAQYCSGDRKHVQDL